MMTTSSLSHWAVDARFSELASTSFAAVGPPEALDQCGGLRPSRKPPHALKDIRTFFNWCSGNISALARSIRPIRKTAARSCSH